MAKAQDTKGSKDLLAKLRKRYATATEADRANRIKAMDDLRFLHVPGEQWDSVTRRQRGERPMYEFNKLRVTVKRIVNDMRANRPSAKVRGVEDGDTETAEVLEGLIRNIWNTSDADTVIDHACEYQVGGGMGAWRVCVDYTDDDAFDQDICIEAIRNPFCLFWDPAAQDALKRDSAYWILTDSISSESFAARYPKANPVSWDAGEFEDDDEWNDGDNVRICEYWWKEPVTRRLNLLSDGSTIDADELPGQLPEGLTVVRERTVRSHKIMMAICSGDAVLEGPTEWAGREFPFIVVFGEQVCVDGEHHWFGLTRFSKDAQRSYNYSRSLAIESVSLAPQAKFWATPDQAKGLTQMWAEAHQKNYPFQLYNPDAKAPGPPVRMGGADVPVALIQEMQISSDDIKSTTGIFDASLGNRSNEASGVAIRTRQAQGEIATFNFMDNLSKGVRRTWEICIDLVPRIYDTARSVRVLGRDGSDDYVEVNKFVQDPMTGEQRAINDLGRGKYDVAVSAGPSFTTQRQEASEVYMQLAQSNPAIFGIAGDLIMKSLDYPYADDIAERLRVMLPPPIQQTLEKEGGDGEGETMSPAAQQAMQQAQQAMQQVQAMGEQLKSAGAEVEQGKAELAKQKAMLEVQAAKLEASYQTKLAQIAQKEAALAQAEAQAGVEFDQNQASADRQALSAELQTAMAEIRAQAAEFMAQAANAIASQPPPQVVVQNPPKQKVVRVRRVNGELVGTVEEAPLQ